MPKLDSINAATEPATINTSTSPSMHPASLGNFASTLVDGEEADFGSAAYEAGRRALKALYESDGQIDSAHSACMIDNRVGVMASTGKPIIRREIDPARAGELGAAMASSLERTTQVTEANLSVIDNSINKLSTSVEVALKNPRANEISVAQAASEIRGWVKSLDPKERVPTLLKAIEEGDHEIASAVLQTACFTSGLSREEHARVRDLAAAKFAARQYRQLNAATQVRARVESSMQKWVTDYFKRLPQQKQSAPDAPIAALRG